MSARLTERADNAGDRTAVGGADSDDDVAMLSVDGANDGDDKGKGDDDDNHSHHTDTDDAQTIREAGSVNGETEGEDEGENEDEEASNVNTGQSMRSNGVALRSNGVALRQRYRALQNDSDAGSDDGGASALGLPRRPGSPAGSISSSRLSMMSMSSVSGSRNGTPTFRPFEQRFKSRMGSPGLQALHDRAVSWLGSPGSSVAGSIAGSVASMAELGGSTISADSDGSPPWDVVRWTKLTKLSAQVFSEAARRTVGRPTCMAVAASIVLGTTKGLLLVFDYQQTLTRVIGASTAAVQAGAVTAVAVSADHSTVGAGHADGSIFTWELARPTRPFLHIGPPSVAAMARSPRVLGDGHVVGATITSLWFLGSRRTALVSADDRGMAFAHLATRGTGSLGRTVQTSRILGRYPTVSDPGDKAVRPSTVLAFATLPLGNVERATDAMGLTAMLTPYLLVIVSTTPVANTQYKARRPKEMAAHGALTGCLAWFPAVRLKTPDARTGATVVGAKLVYGWSNVLTVLDVDEEPAATVAEDGGGRGGSGRPPALRCRARSRWTCEEALVAVQWLTRSVIVVLTISQRLLVLEDATMRVTETYDLANRYIYHTDLFSRQLQGVVETLDEGDPSMHGVVGDAFFMSFRTYRGRLFLLGFNDVAMGALSNWADRLVALMEHGDCVGAIRLAMSYYLGSAADGRTLGLPEDAVRRQGLVRGRLLEMMEASLAYVFGRSGGGGRARAEVRADELAQTCVAACADMEAVDVLFERVYVWFSEGDAAGVFMEALEPYVLDGRVTAVPPTVVKALVQSYVANGQEDRLEAMLCRIDTTALDLDETTTLCKQHKLYDALAYVWNQALHDFVTPLEEMLAVMAPNADANHYDNDAAVRAGSKVFPYLAYVLTGRAYPTDTRMDATTQQQAKAELYWFLFCGTSVVWPPGSSGPPLRTRADGPEPSFPYLRLLLQFDAASFLSALHEAFEDAFLNEAATTATATTTTTTGVDEAHVFGRSVDRQFIVTILLELMGDSSSTSSAGRFYLDMFVARSLPKYPQYLLLPESTLAHVLTGLCHYPDADVADDAQLSAEYLLSVYHPPDMAALLPQFTAAGFFRILKQTYRANGQLGPLLQAAFDDPVDRHGIFACIAECLGSSGRQRGDRQRHEALTVLQAHAGDLMARDAAVAARTLAAHAPDLHGTLLAAAKDRPDEQYVYLKTLLEGDDWADQADGTDGADGTADGHLVEQYIQLLCTFDPAHVAGYIEALASAPGASPLTVLRLDTLLPAMEEAGVVDGAVVLLAHEGEVQAAMARLVRHLHVLESAVAALRPDEVEEAEAEADDGSTVVQRSAAEELMQALQKYTHVGIWLCQTQTRVAGQGRQRVEGTASTDEMESMLRPDEQLWLELMSATVQITRNLGTYQHAERVIVLLRSLVQHTFTALLTATATGPRSTVQTAATTPTTTPTTSLSFLRILKAFLARAAAASPSLADLRQVLASVFAAYAYEAAMLRLANRLLDRSLFSRVSDAAVRRQRGWRAKGSTCEACGRRVWGPGVQQAMTGAGAGPQSIFGAWEARQAADAERRQAKRVQHLGGIATVGKDGVARDSSDAKGKATARTPMPLPAFSFPAASSGSSSGSATPTTTTTTTSASTPTTLGPRTMLPLPGLGPVVLFSCRHVYHQACLETLTAEARGNPVRSGLRTYVCPLESDKVQDGI